VLFLGFLLVIVILLVGALKWPVTTALANFCVATLALASLFLAVASFGAALGGAFWRMAHVPLDTNDVLAASRASAWLTDAALWRRITPKPRSM